LIGYARKREDFGFSELDRRRWDERDAQIDAALGSETAEALRARGAAMQPAEIVAYLRAESERVLSPQA
jgi:hypothetical protein